MLIDVSIRQSQCPTPTSPSLDLGARTNQTSTKRRLPKTFPGSLAGVMPMGHGGKSTVDGKEVFQIRLDSSVSLIKCMIRLRPN